MVAALTIGPVQAPASFEIVVGRARVRGRRRKRVGVVKSMLEIGGVERTVVEGAVMVVGC
jgi:hypothetical protein